jgi:hypothetical protein
VPGFCAECPLVSRECRAMLKLIGLLVAAMPVILFLRAMFMGSKKRSQAVSNFKKQVDYVVWVILFFIGCGVVFSVGKLIYEWRFAGP